VIHTYVLSATTKLAHLSLTQALLPYCANAVAVDAAATNAYDTPQMPYPSAAAATAGAAPSAAAADYDACHAPKPQ
jgi:hypothetical protein